VDEGVLGLGGLGAGIAGAAFGVEGLEVGEDTAQKGGFGDVGGLGGGLLGGFCGDGGLLGGTDGEPGGAHFGAGLEGSGPQGGFGPVVQGLAFCCLAVSETAVVKDPRHIHAGLPAKGGLNEGRGVLKKRRKGAGDGRQPIDKTMAKQARGGPGVGLKETQIGPDQESLGGLVEIEEGWGKGGRPECIEGAIVCEDSAEKFLAFAQKGLGVVKLAQGDKGFGLGAGDIEAVAKASVETGLGMGEVFLRGGVGAGGQFGEALLGADEQIGSGSGLGGFVFGVLLRQLADLYVVLCVKPGGPFGGGKQGKGQGGVARDLIGPGEKAGGVSLNEDAIVVEAIVGGKQGQGREGGSPSLDDESDEPLGVGLGEEGGGPVGLGARDGLVKIDGNRGKGRAGSRQGVLRRPRVCGGQELGQLGLGLFGKGDLGEGRRYAGGESGTKNQSHTGTKSEKDKEARHGGRRLLVRGRFQRRNRRGRRGDGEP